MHSNESEQHRPGNVQELLARIKSGDEGAARELLARFESKVRLVVRRQLPRLLRSRFDSLDFLQSVWGSFFFKIRTGPNDLDKEENLITFLAWAARNKVIDEYRRAATQRQDIKREQPLDGLRDKDLGLASGDTPSQLAQAHETYDRLRDLLPEDQRFILELKAAGHSSREIGERRGRERTHGAAGARKPQGPRPAWGPMRMSLTYSGPRWDDTATPAIALVVQKFEADWRSAPGLRPDPGLYLPDDPGQRPAVLLALLRADLVLRWTAREQCPIEFYRERFPELESEALVALLYEEFSLREEAGESPQAAEYIERFPDIADSFQEVIDIHDLFGRDRSVASAGSCRSGMPFPDAGPDDRGVPAGRGAGPRCVRPGLPGPGTASRRPVGRIEGDSHRFA